ncbi:MAG: dimethylarginine dimethylaminohydrolase family protein, partial [Candidatus Thorarchaeota archaeon]
KHSAYGGDRWSPRTDSLQKEIGSIWSSCGINSEWAKLKSVLLHRPGIEMEILSDPDAVQMLEIPNIQEAMKQHDAIAHQYRNAQVEVNYIEPKETPTPNLMFVADLLFMTPEGIILSRPASTVRAGEERIVAVRLAEMGIPILTSIRGNGTFEGADALWINPGTVILGIGIRTNKEGAEQVSRYLDTMDVKVITVELHAGSMHLMGVLRFANDNLAIGIEKRTPKKAAKELKKHGYDVLYLPDFDEIRRMALNFVTLGPNQILMASGCPKSQKFFEKAGIKCQTVEIGELAKAAGGIGCLTGVLERK